MHSANNVGNRYSLGGSCEFAMQPEVKSETKPDVMQQHWWRAPPTELHRQLRPQHLRPTPAEQEDEVMFDPRAAGPAVAASADRMSELVRYRTSLASMPHATKDAEGPSMRQPVTTSETTSPQFAEDPNNVRAREQLAAASDQDAPCNAAAEPSIQPRTSSPNLSDSNPTSTTSDAAQHVAEQPQDDEAADIFSTQQPAEEVSQTSGAVSTEASIWETEQRNERPVGQGIEESMPAAAPDVPTFHREGDEVASLEPDQLPQQEEEEQEQEQEVEEDDRSKKDAEQQQMIDALQAAKYRTCNLPFCVKMASFDVAMCCQDACAGAAEEAAASDGAPNEEAAARASVIRRCRNYRRN